MVATLLYLLKGEGSVWYGGHSLWPLKAAACSELESQFYHSELIYLLKQVISSV